MCNKFSLQRPLLWGKILTKFISIKTSTVGSLLLTSLLSIPPVFADFFEPPFVPPEPTIEEMIAQSGTARVIIQLGTDSATTLDLPSTTSLDQKAAQAASLQDAFLQSLETFGIMGLTNTNNLVKAKFKFIPAVVMKVDELLLEQVESNPLVTNVKIDGPISPALIKSIPLIGADKAWQQGYTGSGQAIAIIDGGVDKTHPALANRVIEEACFSINDADNNITSLCPNGLEEQIGTGSAAPPCDLGLGKCYHGTHVAGIAAANSVVVNGVAKAADLIAIQVFYRVDDDNECGVGNSPCLFASESTVIHALEHVLSLYNDGIVIASANLSLGGGSFTTPCDEDDPIMTEAINNLREVGIASVIASGNEGTKGAMASPACISSAISVGATCNMKHDETDPRYHIPYDIYCPGGTDTVALFSDSATFLDLLAPGMWVLSTIPSGGTAYAGGTSQAAPHVAGAWAVLKSIKPDLTVDQVLAILEQTGVPIVDEQNNLTKPRIQLDKAAQAVKALAVTLPDLSVVPEAEGFRFMWKQSAELDSGGGMNLLCAQMDQDSHTFNPPVKLNQDLKAAMDQVFYPLAGVSGVQYCTLMEINAAGKCTLHCDATVVISEPSSLAVSDVEAAKTLCHEYANNWDQLGTCPNF